MSEIDSYRHECIGMVSCPSSFLPNAYWRQPERMIPIYRLDEDAFDGHSFKAKSGDFLLGGGSGECPALRISVPEAFDLFSNGEDGYEDVCRAYWSTNDAFVFGDGYIKLGWQPATQPIECWLAEQILAFVLKEYPTQYEEWQGSLEVEEIRAICRRPNVEELADL